MCSIMGVFLFIIFLFIVFTIYDSIKGNFHSLSGCYYYYYSLLSCVDVATRL